MLACQNWSVQSPQGQCLVSGVAADFARGQLHAIIGPSGCGKTSLLRSWLGLLPASGELLLSGQRLPEAQTLAGYVGYAPQFPVVSPLVSVEEALRDTLQLAEARAARWDEACAHTLTVTGLEGLRHQRVESLSGGQLRRLGLAQELVLNPACLLCDEVTSGLDPRSEGQLLEVMRQQAEAEGQTYVCVIHNLAQLERFDTVTVLYLGRLVFQGSLDKLLAWFGLSDALHLYDLLAEQSPEVWAARWAERAGPGKVAGFAASSSVVGQPLEPPRRPGLGRQLRLLWARRWRRFVRDRGYLGLTLALTLGFPCLVVIFALEGLPQIERLALQPQGGFVEQLQESLRVRWQQGQTAQLVTGLIMFQVILLTLMGANNGGREIAAEREQVDKEGLCGLKPVAYLASKLGFTGVLALIQGAYMAWFVKGVCQFPGALLPQMLLLGLVALAMSWVCLAFSAWSRSAERASLLSVYLVGFQLPLSGVVLALPEALEWVCRPFISAYWGWAGYLSTLRDSPIYDAWRQSQEESWQWVPGEWFAAGVLIAQASLGALLVWLCLGPLSHKAAKRAQKKLSA